MRLRSFRQRNRRRLFQTQDSLAWDKEIEEDFSPGGKHHGLLAEIDAAIDGGKGTPLPRLSPQSI